MPFRQWLRVAPTARQSIVVRLALLLFIATIALTLFLGSLNDNYSTKASQTSLCYRSSRPIDSSIERFPDILDDRHQPLRNASNIFFHETSCRADGIAELNVRQACAIESAARANPGAQVYVLFASPVGFRPAEPMPVRFHALSAYPNVRWLSVDLWSYADRTPAGDWMRTGALFESRYLLAHMADLLRLLSLFRWGGTHIDLDFVVRSSLAHLQQNWIAEEQTGLLSNAIFNLGSDPAIGHPLASRMLSEFANAFNGSVWSENGPRAVTRVLRAHCGQDATGTMQSLLECRNFNVLASDKFYAIYYPDWMQLFDVGQAVAAMRRVRLSLAVHLWNKLSADQPVRVGERSAYERLVRTHCPRVFGTVPKAAQHGSF